MCMKRNDRHTKLVDKIVLFYRLSIPLFNSLSTLIRTLIHIDKWLFLFMYQIMWHCIDQHINRTSTKKSQTI